MHTMIPRSTLTVGVRRADGSWAVRPFTVANTWLKPGWFAAAAVLFGVPTGAGFRPYDVVALGTDGTPTPAHRTLTGLIAPITDARAIATPSVRGGIVRLAVTFQGAALAATAALVREAAVYDALDPGTSGPALFRYVFPTGLTLTPAMTLPLVVNIDLAGAAA